ncbi:YetF domain-containing protein [Halobacillus sp. SY10]|uniref:YetF domain-containing protein n=1 Tax=Halobacillus sp. SY10 TaxID=3381356 RepID=UPI0038792F26
MSISVLLVRLTIAFFTLLILARLMGRKEISQMTFFNFISAISIGTIGASLAIDSTLSVRNGLIALAVWSAFTILMGVLDIKSISARKTLDGEPIILIKKGKILEEEMKKTRLDLDELNVLLRKKNVFSVADVDYAIFETDGTLSVLQKQGKRPATKEDVHTPYHPVASSPDSSVVIKDGKVNHEHLKRLHLDLENLEAQLAANGFNSLDDVFYAEVKNDGSLYVDAYSDDIH